MSSVDSIATMCVQKCKGAFIYDVILLGGEGVLVNRDELKRWGERGSAQ